MYFTIDPDQYLFLNKNSVISYIIIIRNKITEIIVAVRKRRLNKSLAFSLYKVLIDYLRPSPRCG